MTKLWSLKNLEMNVFYVDEDRKISTMTAYQSSIVVNPDRNEPEFLV